MLDIDEEPSYITHNYTRNYITNITEGYDENDCFLR